MDFLSSPLAGKNNWWRYTLMLLAIIVCLGIASILAGIVIVMVFPESVNLEELQNNQIGGLPLFVTSMMTFVVGFFVLCGLIKPLHCRTAKSIFTSNITFNKKNFIIATIVMISLLSFFGFIEMFLNKGTFTFNYTGSQFWKFLFAAVVLLIFQTGFEEILFRGYLIQGFNHLLKNKILALFVSSLVFALMHCMNSEVLNYGFGVMMSQYFLIGLLFGLVTILSNGIEIAWGLHYANNLTNVCLFTCASSSLQTDTLFVNNRLLSWIDIAILLIQITIILTVGKKLWKFDYKQLRQ